MKSKGKILVKIRRNKQENIQEPLEKSQYRQEVLKKIEDFIYQNNIVQIEEKYGWSIDKIKHLRKSYMIKFALSKGEYFES